LAGTAVGPLKNYPTTFHEKNNQNTFIPILMTCINNNCVTKCAAKHDKTCRPGKALTLTKKKYYLWHLTSSTSHLCATDTTVVRTGDAMTLRMKFFFQI